MHLGIEMTGKLMDSRLSKFFAFLSGLLAAQGIAFFQVYDSNLAMHQRITGIIQSGYAHMPNANLVAMLKMWLPAFAGGVFFSLSIGAGLALVTIAILWIWEAVCRRKKSCLYFFVGLWASFLIFVNLAKISIFPSLYVICIPAVVSYAYKRLHRRERSGGRRLIVVCHLACIAVLALIWATQARSGMFLVIRDNLLLTNPVGMKINGFYYRYTHYSAEVITALHQKLFKTYRRSIDHSPELAHRLDYALAGQGYFRLSAGKQEDIHIKQEKDQLVFDSGGKQSVFQIAVTDFLKAPQTALKTLSIKLDGYKLFRRMIFYSLLIAFPITLYWMLHTAVASGLSLLMAAQKASLLGILVCFLLGAGLFVPVYLGRDKDIGKDQLAEALTNRNWRVQVSALKSIAHDNLEIFRIGPYRQLMQSPHVPVQYWLAQALGKSRHPQTYQDLIKLLHAAHPNVVCQAVAGIGRRGSARDIPRILSLIEHTNHWYILRYAYHALRNLGWKQKKSE
jgi:hypothetical protein